MKFIRLVLRRPVSAFLLIFAVVVFGISSLMGMPLEYLPDMEMPMELVLILWPGADADSIERLVTEPVEEECETLSDIDTVSSYTFDNYTMIQIQYNYGVDMDDVYMDLKTSMDNLASDLPDDCEDPVIMEISASAMATMTISASAPDGTDIQSYLNDTVVPKLESLSGVAQVEVSGASDEYLRIVLDEAKLEQYGLSTSAIGSAISTADFDMPVGTVTAGTQDIALSAFGDIEVSTPNIRQVPIQTASGQIVRLGDVATFINLYHEEADSVSRYNGNESALLEVTKQNSASTVSVCGSVDETLAQFTAADGVHFQSIYSEADSIKESLASVLQTLMIGVLLTMLILLIFFGNIRASLIVGCSMPLSILIAMILLNFAGFNFDLMTGVSLVIAIGMIVDNSIVVLESCMRAQERGLDFKEAAAQGTGEVLMSIFGSTLTTVIVYIPLGMAQGMSGQMAGPLSWTIALTMLSSFLCAVAVVPLIFSLIHPRAKSELPINRLLAQLQRFYRRVTPALLRRPGLVVLTAVALLAAAIFLAAQLEFVLFPNNYDGSIRVAATFRSGTKLEVMDEKIRPLETALLSDEDFEDVTLSLSDNTATFTAYAADHSRRTSEEAVELYTTLFGSEAGMDVTVTPSGANSMSSLMTSGNEVEITLSGGDLDSLEQGANLVEEAFTQIPGVLKVNNEFAQSRLQGRIVVDSQKAMAFGMTQMTVALQINSLLNGSTVATIDYGDQEYDVKLEYPEGKYDSLDALMDHTIATPTGVRITLSDIADIEYTNSLPTIKRQDETFIASISATTTDEAKYEVQAAMDAAIAQMDFPQGVGRARSSMDRMTKTEVTNMVSAMAAGIFLVFLVMAVQFDSPRLSLMVMLCIPMSLIGSFLLEFLTGRPMSVMGIMGFLMLFGIVVNNGILLIDATNMLRQTMPLEEALIQAGVTRLRPILMTSLTTILSMVPMLFSNDSGMSMMKEMAYIIIGGLCASTVLTLFLMPPFYLLIRRENVDGTKKRGLFRRKKRAAV